MTKAIIIGVTGQDGSYLADFLLEKGYEVHGVRRRTSSDNLSNLRHLDFSANDKNNFKLHYGDVTDSSNILKLIEEIRPSEIYNMAAQSHVHVSFQIPEYTSNVDGLGTLRILEAIKSIDKNIKFYQASTSELYGKVFETPQDEETQFNPQSPYAIAKQYGFWITKMYREAYNMFAVNGILFNHESPRRGPTFVSRKITMAISNIVNGNQEKLYLGNLDAKRDWGFAKEYVEAMWLMLQQEVPEDFIISTGKSHSVREFVELAFDFVNIKIIWKGKGISEKGIDKKTGKILVEIDPYFFRPLEVEELNGNSSKAKDKLSWSAKTSFKDLVKIMMKSDLDNL